MSKIMGISRLRTGTDGQGITTLVTFYDCPLKCKYCINDKCHYGKETLTEYKPEELVALVRIDDIYFRMSGGGITFGGGEPLLHAKFIERFARMAPKEWRIRMETSLNITWKAIELLIPYVDQWIIDIKDMNDEIYKNYTGNSNAMVKSNLKKLTDRVPANHLYLRFPNIPGYNTPKDVERSLLEVKNIDCIKEVFDYVYVDTEHINNQRIADYHDD